MPSQIEERNGKKQTVTKNWMTCCIILESNPLVTQPEEVTQSSNLGVVTNSNVVERTQQFL